FSTGVAANPVHSLLFGDIMSIHFSLQFHEWETPQDFFEGVDSLLQFEIDVAAKGQNAKLSEAMDALRQDWSLSPPYGRGIVKWMAKVFTANTSIAGLYYLERMLPISSYRSLRGNRG